MIEDDDSYADTTEDRHSHYCVMCGGKWSHTDESCVGPRFRGYSPYDPDFTCPSCLDPR